jgi:hypothetical protein
MDIDQTQPVHTGAIREILTEELDGISGGWYFDPVDSPPQPPHMPTPGGPRLYRPMSDPS